MRKTEIRAHEHGYIRAEYGEHVMGDQEPYWSVTAEISDRSSFSSRAVHSCGCLHDDVRRHFPELAHTIKWYLSNEGVPMHYLANAKYWHDLRSGAVRKTASNVPQGCTVEEAFVRHCIELEGEYLVLLLGFPWAEVEPALRARIPALRAAYAADTREWK